MATDDRPRSRFSGALEEMPHIERKVCILWPSPELDLFISEVLMDARDGGRQGMPVEVANELMFLAQSNKVIRAMDRAKQLNIPVSDAYRAIDAGDQERLRARAQGGQLLPEIQPDVRRAVRPAEAPSAREARRRAELANGPVALLGQLVFKVVSNPLLLLLIAAAVGLYMVWPALAPVPR